MENGACPRRASRISPRKEGKRIFLLKHTKYHIDEKFESLYFSEQKKLANQMKKQEEFKQEWLEKSEQFKTLLAEESKR